MAPPGPGMVRSSTWCRAMGGPAIAAVNAFRLWRASVGVRVDTGGLPIATNWANNFLACGARGMIASYDTRGQGLVRTRPTDVACLSLRRQWTSCLGVAKGNMEISRFHKIKW